MNVYFETKRIFFLLLNIFLFIYTIKAQTKIQDKIYIQDDFFLIPSVDGRVATVQCGKLDEEMDSVKLFALPISVSKIANYEVNYCLGEQFIISASLTESRGVFSTGPYFVAISTDSLNLLNSFSIQEYISGFNETFHNGKDLIKLDGLPLIERITTSISTGEAMDFDFAYDELKNKLYVASVIKNEHLKVWMYDVSKSGIQSCFYKHTEKNKYLKPVLIGDYYLFQDNTFSLFSLDSKLYVLLPNEKAIYEICDDMSLRLVSTFSKSDYDIKSHSIVVNKDAKTLTLLPKQVIDSLEKYSFQEILDRYGVRVRL